MMKPPWLYWWLFLEESYDADDDICRYPDDQYPKEVIGQHGHNDGKEYDRQEDRDKTVPVQDFDNAGYKWGACNSGKSVRMFLEGIDEPMAKSDRHRPVKRDTCFFGQNDVGES